MVVSIVILNWNRKKDTRECIESLVNSDFDKSKFEVIVVDNGSTDGSEQELKKIGTRGVNYEVIPNGKNLGFAAGNNVGIRHALNHGSEFVFILNNDTIVDRKLLSNLMYQAKTYPRAGILVPKIYFARGFEFHKDRYKERDLGKVIWYAGGKIDWKNVYASNLGVDEIDKGQYDGSRPTDFATGAAMLCRTSAISKVGDFDERYFMYLEDADLSVRMKKNGYAVIYSPKALLWHKVAQSSKIGGELNDYFICRNRLLFGMKYAGLKTKMALIKESFRFLKDGRKWQKIAVKDFYFMRFGKGSWI